MQIPQEEYTNEKAKALREKFWGKPEPDEVLVIEGIDDVIFEEEPTGPEFGPAEPRGFCPTGKGGGIDNSCSSKDGGGGGPDLAIGDSIRRKDVQVGQTISVQKHGQNKVHNGVVTSVKHEDAVSEITLKDSNGNETTIRIRNLAKIREANLGDDSQVREPSAPKEPKAAKPKGKLEVPQKPEINTKKERERFRQEVKDFCQAHGVSVVEPFGGKTGSSVDSLHEIAVGVNRLVNAGQEPPARIVMTQRDPYGKPMGRALGFYHPGRSDTIFVHARMPPGEPQHSINTGFIAGSSASGIGTVIVHENGHRLHHKALGDKEFDRMPRPSKHVPTTLSFRDHSTAGQVSRYAQTCEVEFVAETYSGHISGRRYSDEVYALYDRYGGPKLPGVRKTKGGKIKVKN